MKLINDPAIYIAVFNMLSTLGNLMWTWKLNSARGSNELIIYWQQESEKKDSEIDDLNDEIRRLRKRIQVYAQYHNHKV